MQRIKRQERNKANKRERERERERDECQMQREKRSKKEKGKNARRLDEIIRAASNQASFDGRMKRPDVFCSPTRKTEFARLSVFWGMPFATAWGGAWWLLASLMTYEHLLLLPCK